MERQRSLHARHPLPAGFERDHSRERGQSLGLSVMRRILASRHRRLGGSGRRSGDHCRRSALTSNVFERVILYKPGFNEIIEAKPQETVKAETPAGFSKRHRRLMSSWLRRLADRLERARCAARQARDAELPAALKREPQEPPVDPIEDLCGSSASMSRTGSSVSRRRKAVAGVLRAKNKVETPPVLLDLNAGAPAGRGRRSAARSATRVDANRRTAECAGQREFSAPEIGGRRAARRPRPDAPGRRRARRAVEATDDEHHLRALRRQPPCRTPRPRAGHGSLNPSSLSDLKLSH